jgi:cellobiose-specific phosphotransferase system component IIA
MPYQSKQEQACAEIENARDAVAKARQAYSRGGSIDAVNEANRRLADAHHKRREIIGGRVPDRR